MNTLLDVCTGHGLRLAAIGAAMLAGLLGALGAAADDWRIQAGSVEISPGNDPQVTGSYFVHAPAGTPPDAAPRTGGACLLADLLPLGIGRERCDTAADCNGPDAIETAGEPQLEAFTGYCVRRAAAAQAGRCWYRPGPPQTHCHRSVDGYPLTPGEHHLGPVSAQPLGPGVPIRDWIIYACIAEDGYPRGCGSESSEQRQISTTPLEEP